MPQNDHSREPNSREQPESAMPRWVIPVVVAVLSAGLLVYVSTLL